MPIEKIIVSLKTTVDFDAGNVTAALFVKYGENSTDAFQWLITPTPAPWPDLGYRFVCPTRFKFRRPRRTEADRTLEPILEGITREVANLAARMKRREVVDLSQFAANLTNLTKRPVHEQPL